MSLSLWDPSDLTIEEFRNGLSVAIQQIPDTPPRGRHSVCREVVLRIPAPIRAECKFFDDDASLSLPANEPGGVDDSV
eukprot:4953680-Karenia_brevis.AAC.1